MRLASTFRKFLTIFPMPNSLQFSADFCITRRVFKPAPPSRQPRALRRVARDVTFGRPSVELFSFLVDFCTPQKSLKNRIPQNTSQKLSKSTCFAPLAAQNRFLTIWVSILASFWHPFFIKKLYFFENRQKHENLDKQMKNYLPRTIPTSSRTYSKRALQRKL